MKHIITFILIFSFQHLFSQTQVEKLVITDSVTYIVEYNYNKNLEVMKDTYKAKITVYKANTIGTGKTKIGKSFEGTYANNKFFMYNPIECVKMAVYGEMKKKNHQ